MVKSRRLKNKYYILRHGQTIHQTNKKDIIYGWPDDTIPCGLTSLGKKQIKHSAQQLKNEKIDLIFSSDARRTKETAEIVAQALGSKKVIFDTRLRDKNWGIFQEKPKSLLAGYFKDPTEMLTKAPARGESWQDVQKRIAAVIKNIESRYQGKNVLIISHGDPLCLLQGWMYNLDTKDLLYILTHKNEKIIKGGLDISYPQPGEWRKLAYNTSQ